MAVSLTVDQLMTACRVDDTTANREIMTRLLVVASAKVERFGPSAPIEVQNEAAIRYAAYLYDQPQTHPGTAYGAGFRNSGALYLLTDYRVHGAGVIG